MVYLRAVKLEQLMLQQRAKLQWLKGGDHCTRFFFRRVATRRARMRVFQINGEDGYTHTNTDAVVAEFVGFYQRLLGGERRRCCDIDLTPYRHRMPHIITTDEGLRMIHQVTREEVKAAFFDIAEDKSPGPDGYSATFFKAAWPVVGEEVTQAVLDFFQNGRLLKQINATLLTLIPKVHAPTTVSDFRPISCCSALYKAITKILVSRIKDCLDDLISPTQNAFVPGRKIGDNVMLAQELFMGYNQRHLPERCALKVDLRKAYDTMEWDFLLEVLRLFGFPSRFIGWIEECVTTPYFSICINREAHGFFRGARGLRQGDPMSPYLFVLVMELLRGILQQMISTDPSFQFHWKCAELGLFQLGFADDLLLFCAANHDSIGLFQHGLDLFASLSGLHMNPAKSQLILSKAAHTERTQLLQLLGFQEGILPVHYLGLPLISSRFSLADCRPLLQKIDDRIHGWEGTFLSFAARVQLIKSVLMALSTYWAMDFVLPKGIINEIERWLRSFLWKGTTGSGYSKVAWARVYAPIEEGGLGIRNLLALNMAMIVRKLWESWRKMLRLRAVLLPHITFRIGDGTKFSLWHDPWHHLGPLISRFPLGPNITGTHSTDHLQSMIVEGSWRWPAILDLGYVEITHDLPPIHGGQDSIRWNGGSVHLSNGIAYALFQPRGPKLVDILNPTSTCSLSASTRAFVSPISDVECAFRGHL
ncbi:UNVERIFIED_CONTAM: LINE-1 retrotransposable element O protein [Sesamum latifolium]|uniref:LINE-1 retrotransposable element O protein n=1 Tax=Sesamum latifolium TaxID=2727402 RepID=A0AAW2XMX2_9LAMI